MKKLLLILMLVSMNANAATAFFSYEHPTGMTKQCVYTYLMDTYTLTLSRLSICPLTIQV